MISKEKTDIIIREYKKKVELICPQCGKKFERYIYDIKKRNAKYCSLSCLNKSKKIRMPSRKTLFNRYWKDKISVNKIAKEYMVSKFLIYKWMEKMEIPTRTIGEGVSIAQTGIKHNKEWNEAISNGHNNMKPELKKKIIESVLKYNINYGDRSRGGTRDDLGIYVRSGWEANICRYYNFIKIKWEYESTTYYFNDSPIIKNKIRKGTLSYTPDFRLIDSNTLIEIKGFFRSKDITKLKRFKKYYPNEFNRLKFIIYNKYARSKMNGEQIHILCDILKVDFDSIISYKEIKNKLSKLIPNWE